ncbi:MAG: phospho-sugar mutase [Chthoniobacterales bacterium]
MSAIATMLRAAVKDGLLLPDVEKNILHLLAGSQDPLTHRSIEELIDAEEWNELNDRFFRTLVFGTGGLRGRTISKITTPSEQGNSQNTCPEHPAIGTNTMNFFNIRRATLGLATYLLKQFPNTRPRVCIAHDTRYFSRAFAEECARILIAVGCDALLFKNHRSTPELSFAIRHTESHAGVNITASHNPPAYNGYKVYYQDGGQIIEPHASGIIAEVEHLESDTYQAISPEKQGRLHELGEEIDTAYLDRLSTLPIQPELFKNAKKLRVIFSPLHGTGAVTVRPLLEKFGVQLSLVESQNKPDGGFPTVKSPNPEEPEALALAIEQGQKENADLVLATDPDADRMGAAIRDTDGTFKLLTGNQIGSLMAWYRAETIIKSGLLGDHPERGVIIKTLVTTELQSQIAKKRGLHCVNTLTGFKYIGAKLQKYENAIPENLRKNYHRLSEAETRKLRLEHSHLYLFGGEESYGYSGSDFVRDKDANSSVLMLVEVAAYAKNQGQTLLQLLDAIYCEHGYFSEIGKSFTLEGAAGAEAIRTLTTSYAQEPPKELAGLSVEKVLNFAQGDIRDEEGDLLPKEKMLILHLADGYQVAIRPSGTEPKIKFYLAGSAGRTGIHPNELPTTKREVNKQIEAIWQALESNVQTRLKKSI